MVKPRIQNLLVLGLGEIASRGFSFVAFCHLGHKLSPSELGTFGTAMAVMMFGALTLDQGLPIYGSRGIARDPKKTEGLTRDIVSAQLWLALFVYGLLWLATATLNLNDQLVFLIRGLGISLFALPFHLNWVFQGRNNMLWYALPTAIRQGIFCILVYLLIRTTEDLEKLPIAEVSASAVAACLFIFAYRRSNLNFSINWRSAWNPQLFREALPIGVSNFIWALRTYLPIVVLYWTIDSRASGLFEPGHRIIMVFVAFLGVYFTNIFPALSASARHDKKEMTKLIRRALSTSVVGTILLALIVTLLGEFMIGLIVDKSAYVTDESVLSLTLLAWLLPILAWRRCARFGLIVLDEQKLELKCSILGLVLLVALIGPLTASFGLVGAGLAMLISEFFGSLVSWIGFRRVEQGQR